MRKLITTLSIISFSVGLAIGYHLLDNKTHVVVCEADTLKSVEEYYSSITSNMKGNDLKVALYNIIKGHEKRSYNTLEHDMKITDRNWALSPKEEDENPKMVLLYADYNTSSPCEWNLFQGGGSNGGVASGYIWNKEHIWAKSNGFNTKNLAAYSDLHHLRASDWKCNNTRSSYPFANVSNGEKVDNAYGNKTNNKCNGHQFEPADEYKGDVARALFYMATRYYNGDGSGGTNLTLTNDDDSSNGTWGYLSTLLEWNELDPVDDFEMHRNDLIYERFQHNRNPYIDHPEYAKAVFNNEQIVEPKTLTNLTISGTPTRLEYKAGDSFDPTGLIVTATFDDNSTLNVTSSVKWTPNPLTEGTTKVTGTYKTKTVEVTGLTVTKNDTPYVPPVLSDVEITFKTDGSETAELKGNAIYEYIDEGKEYVSSLSDANKIYGSSYGIKMGSGKENGALTINFNQSYEVESVILKAKRYGSDSSEIKVSTAVNQSGISNEVTSELSDITYTFDGSEINFIKLTTVKRVYLSSIIVNVKSDEGDPTTPIDPVDPPVDPTDPEDPPVDPTEPTEPVDPGTSDTPTQTNGCGGNIYTSSIILSALSLSFVVLLVFVRYKRVK